MATDKKNALKELIEMGKSKGRLTGKEILDALEDLDFDPEQMDKLYDSIERDVYKRQALLHNTSTLAISLKSMNNLIL